MQNLADAAGTEWVPRMKTPAVSNYRWQLNALKSRLRHPEPYAELEDVNAMTKYLFRWLIQNIDKATEAERKEAEALFKTGAHRKEA